MTTKAKGQLITVSFIISNQDPNYVVQQAERFAEGKKDFEKHFSTTALAGQVQAPQFGGAQQMQIVFITSCLCIWKSTAEDYSILQNKFALVNGDFSKL